MCILGALFLVLVRLNREKCNIGETLTHFCTICRSWWHYYMFRTVTIKPEKCHIDETLTFPFCTICHPQPWTADVPDDGSGTLTLAETLSKLKASLEDFALRNNPLSMEERMSLKKNELARKAGAITLVVSSLLFSSLITSSLLSSYTPTSLSTCLLLSQGAITLILV